MIKYPAVLLSMFMFAAAAFAQNSETQSKKPDAKLAAAQEAVFDLDARYWAWRIANAKDVSLDALTAWSSAEDQNSYSNKLIKAVKNNLAKNNTAALSPDEEYLRKKSLIQIKNLLNPENTAGLKNALTNRSCLELESRQWANAILTLNKISNGGALRLKSLEHAWKEGTEREQFKLKLIQDMVSQDKMLPMEDYERYITDVCISKFESVQDTKEEEPVSLNLRAQALEETIFDITARYWAWRVALERDITLNELENASKLWWSTPEFNEKIVEAAKENIVNDNTSGLNAEEKQKMAEVRNAVLRFMHAPSYDEQIKEVLSDRNCINVKANFWANKMIADSVDAKEVVPTLEAYAAVWAEPKELRQAVISEAKRRLDEGGVVSVQSYDSYVIEACASNYTDTAR